MNDSHSRLPGVWLLRIARAVFDDAACSDVVEPTIADLRREWLDAQGRGGRRIRARWRGYLAFWKLVLISPFAFWRWPGSSTEPRLPAVSILTAAALLIGLIWRPDLSTLLAPVM